MKRFGVDCRFFETVCCQLPICEAVCVATVAVVAVVAMVAGLGGVGRRRRCRGEGEATAGRPSTSCRSQRHRGAPVLVPPVPPPARRAVRQHDIAFVLPGAPGIRAAPGVIILFTQLHARLVRPPTHSISPYLWASAALAGHLDLYGCGRDCAECGSGRQAGRIGTGGGSGHWH